MEPTFKFVKSDQKAVAAAIRFARWLLAHVEMTPAQIQGIARAIYALQRLPESTEGIDLRFGAHVERGDEEDKEYWAWDVGITPEEFSLSSDGSVWSKQVSGDSVSGYSYEVEVGGYRDKTGPVSSWLEEIKMRLVPPFEVIVEDESTLAELGD